MGNDERGAILHLGRWKADQAEGDSLVAPWAYHTHFDQKTAAASGANEIIHVLKAAGYDGYWGIEYNAPGNPYKETEKLIAAVRKLLLAADEQ